MALLWGRCWHSLVYQGYLAISIILWNMSEIHHAVLEIGSMFSQSQTTQGNLHHEWRHVIKVNLTAPRTSWFARQQAAQDNVNTDNRAQVFNMVNTVSDRECLCDHTIRWQSVSMSLGVHPIGKALVLIKGRTGENKSKNVPHGRGLIFNLKSSEHHCQTILFTTPKGYILESILKCNPWLVFIS